MAASGSRWPDSSAAAGGAKYVAIVRTKSRRSEARKAAYRLKLLLTNRRGSLKHKFLDLENAIRHSLKSFGVRLNKTVAASSGLRARIAWVTRSPAN
jgi:hypothetical protein